jgi:hypothetical protein
MEMVTELPTQEAAPRSDEIPDGVLRAALATLLPVTAHYRSEGNRGLGTIAAAAADVGIHFASHFVSGNPELKEGHRYAATHVLDRLGALRSRLKQRLPSLRISERPGR